MNSPAQSPKPPAPGFYFMRHGQTLANRDRICSGGESDPPLTQLGHDQVRDAGRRLCALPASAPMPQLILASPMRRTSETARILSGVLGLDVRAVRWEAGLIERRLGKWNHQRAEKIQPLLSAGHTPPGGESAAAFRHRVLSVLGGFAPFYPHWPLIIGSRGTGRIVLECAGANAEEAAHLANAAILRITLADAEGFEIVECEQLDGPECTGVDGATPSAKLAEPEGPAFAKPEAGAC